MATFMEDNCFYYISPAGCLRIKNNGDAISEISFMDEHVSMASKQHMKRIPPVLRECIDQLDKYFAGELFSFNCKLAPEGTAFQQLVWEKLQQVPYGRTASYLALSKQVGNIKSIRAVGTANGKNPVAIIIPCHRIIGSNGSLVGYAGGLSRKQWLLNHEAKHANGVQTLF